MAAKTAKKPVKKPEPKAVRAKAVKPAKAAPEAKKAVPEAKKITTEKAKAPVEKAKATKEKTVTPAPKAAAPAKSEKAAAAPVKVEKAAPAEKPKRAEPKALAGKPAAPTEAAPTPTPAPAPKKSKAARALDEEGEKLLKQWSQMHEQMKNTKPVVYTLQGNYEAKTAIQHKVLGWGYVLKNKGNRIEVLFEEGIKTLVTNYKPA